MVWIIIEDKDKKSMLVYKTRDTEGPMYGCEGKKKGIRMAQSS